MDLTMQQRQVVNADGNVLLLACPGSGKTRSAAARIGVLAGGGKMVAVCSYTNVGADRIRTVTGGMGITLGPEHFTGTLHRFLLRYVVQPFGSLVGATRGPNVSAGGGTSVAFAGDPKKRIAVADFRYRPDGSLKLKTRPVYLSTVPEDDIVASVGSEVRRIKRNYFKAGFVTFDDAMFIAMTILRRHPTIARAVAARFDELLLDEAQDTSELQLACVDELKSAGLRSLVMVGDLEQSIFAFQGASAEGCRDLATKHGLREIVLTENHRCSQQICNVAVHFCERTTADIAVGPNADCVIEPEVLLYPPTDPAAAITHFRQRLREHDVDPADAAVLARSRALVNELNGAESPVSVGDRPLTLGRATAALRHGTITRQMLEDVQRIVGLAAWGEESIDGLSLEARERLREETVSLLRTLPTLDEDLRVWIRSAASLLTASATRLSDPPAKKGGQILTSKGEQTGTAARVAFVPPARELAAQTIHDIKGEDRDAVIVVIDRPRSARRGAQAQLWTSALSGQTIAADEAEEKRIAFVALTRAQRLCVVALPDDAAGRHAAGAFVDRGFTLIN
jgi:hypothetical protein